MIELSARKYHIHRLNQLTKPTEPWLKPMCSALCNRSTTSITLCCHPPYWNTLRLARDFCHADRLQPSMTVERPSPHFISMIRRDVCVVLLMQTAVQLHIFGAIQASTRCMRLQAFLSTNYCSKKVLKLTP